jgi:hypothetical protein
MAICTQDKIYRKAEQYPIETVVYVPSTDKNQHKILPEEMDKRVNEVRKWLSKRYGGYTSTNAIGGYAMKRSGIVVQEDVVKVTAYATEEKFKKYKSLALVRLKRWAKKWGQESIAYEYEGDLLYIYS